MRFVETSLEGAFLIEIDRLADERGFFARSFCAREFGEKGLSPSVSQCNISFNSKKGTLRGLHYQRPPHEEAKVVRCTRGSLFDVIVDLRRDSPTYCRWESFELTADNYRMLYVPEGFAHGFQTLVDHTEVLYLMSAFYVLESAAGIRYDDQAFGIGWPLADIVASPRDLSYKEFVP
jgi:dTDP-4-dehydrorhamnose 3,5-epimerase